jgi:uncharacterized protein YukE
MPVDLLAWIKTMKKVINTEGIYGKWGIVPIIAFGFTFGITFGFGLGIVLGITEDIAFSIALGIALGIAGSFAFSTVTSLKYGTGLSVELPILSVIVIGSMWVFMSGIPPSIALCIAFLFTYFRFFYILPHLVQYLRVKIFQHEPFSLFRNSPVYWDEVILMPLMYLSDFLVLLTDKNRSEGLKEIEFVSFKRPTQHKAASSALLEITIQNLNKFDSVEEITQVSNNLSFLSAFEISEEFSNAVRNIENISIDAKSYLDSTNNYNKIRNLQNLLNDVKKFQNILTATKGQTGYKFHSVADKWYQILEDENKKFIEIKKDTFEEIPNLTFLDLLSGQMIVQTIKYLSKGMI